MPIPIVHFASSARRHVNTGCGKTAADSQRTDNPLQVTCKSAGCMNRRESLETVLLSARTTFQSFSGHRYRSAVDEERATVSFPIDAIAARIVSGLIGDEPIVIGTEEAADELILQADALSQAAVKARAMLRDRRLYPDANAMLNSATPLT